MKTAKEIVKETLEASKGDIRAAIDALCDGQYLNAAGYTDEDQTEIECAVWLLQNEKSN